MYQTNIGNSTIQINSVNSSSPIVLMKHNRVILNIIDSSNFITSISLSNMTYPKTLKYHCGFIQTFQVDITNLIDWRYNSSTQAIKITITLGDYEIYESIIRLVAVNGKSYPFRDHINSVHTLLNGEQYVDIFVPWDGFINGNIPVLTGVNTVNTQQTGDNLIITQEPDIQVFDDTFDYTFNGISNVRYDVRINRVCPINDQYCVIHYLNYLGEQSTLLGYIKSDRYNFEGENYNWSYISVYNRDKRLNLGSSTQEITVIIPNSNALDYPSDILLNESVELHIGDRTFTCAPIADSVERNTLIQDYQIKFAII